MFMKRNVFISMFSLFVAATAFVSCLDDDDNDNTICPREVGQAIVTVKPTSSDGSFYMQLDDSTRLYPTNVNASPFGQKEVRAFLLFSSPVRKGAARDFDVVVNRMDSILTKQCAPDLGDKNESTYGNDPVVINGRDWMTVAEDGYLTLRFMTVFSGSHKHLVNLVTGANPDDPYEITFYHNAFGDVNGHSASGIVAFKLDALPDTEGKTVDLTLKWKSYDGDHKTTLKYCTRKASNTVSSDIFANSYGVMAE